MKGEELKTQAEGLYPAMPSHWRNYADDDVRFRLQPLMLDD
jgi:hypothetical protein